jgi:TPR repeat protein
MKVNLIICALALAGLSACTYHPSGLPNGSDLYVDAPTGLVAALPEGVFDHARVAALRCEGQPVDPLSLEQIGLAGVAVTSSDISSCVELASYYLHGGRSPYYDRYCLGGGHGDDHAEGGHGDEHAEAGHGDEHAEAGHGDEHAEAGHGDEHAEAGHGDEHAEAGHGDDGHGAAAGGCSDGHGGFVPTGAPLAQDYAKANELFSFACEAGWLGACVEVARLHLDSHVPAPDLAAAETLFVRACEGGVRSACIELGELYAANRFPGGGTAQSIGAFSTACVMGNATGCERL